MSRSPKLHSTMSEVVLWYYLNLVSNEGIRKWYIGGESPMLHYYHFYWGDEGWESFRKSDKYIKKIKASHIDHDDYRNSYAYRYF